MSESISFFPFIKKLCNLYGQKHYTIKIFDFYINIEETDIIHIDSLFKKYYLLTPKKENTLGEVSTFDNGIEKGINISATDYYFARFKNYNKRTNLNKQILLKLNESKLKNGINKEYYYDVFENSNTVVHEFNHCSKDMLELLNKKGDNDDNVDNGFLIIFENIHKIICYFLEKKNINSFLDVLIL